MSEEETVAPVEPTEEPAPPEEIPVVVVPSKKKAAPKAKAEPKAKAAPKARAKKAAPPPEPESPESPAPEPEAPAVAPEAPKPAPRKPRAPAKSKAAPAPQDEDHSIPEGVRRLHSFADSIAAIHQYNQEQKRQTYRNLLAGLG